MTPTVLEALDLEPPMAIKGVSQSPIEGVSFAHAFDHPEARTKHHTQYFEMFGHRSIYHDCWRAVCPWPGTSFKEAGIGFGAPITAEKLTELDAKNWELYHIDNDWAENHNLAEKHRDKLIEMIATWYVEAGKYKVLPIDSRGSLRVADPRPQIALPRTHYTYYPGTQPIPPNAGPYLFNRPYSFTADVEIPKGGAEGVLVSAGDIQGGYSLFVKDGKLRYGYNYVGSEFFSVISKTDLPEGRHKLRFEFAPTGKPDIAHGKGTPGRVQLYVDGKVVGQGDLPVTIPLMLGLGGSISCGTEAGAAVVPDYKPPFRFTGTIYNVTIDVSGDFVKDAEAEMRVIMAHQ